MTNRTAKVEFYTTPEKKRDIEKRAAAEDTSVSSYCHNVLAAHLQGRAIDEKEKELNAEKRLEELVAVARDEIEEAAANMQDIQAKTAVHNIAMWELIKQDFGPVQRREAMATGSERLREDLEDLGINPDALGNEDSGQGTKDESQPSGQPQTESPGSPETTSTTAEKTDDSRSWSFD